MDLDALRLAGILGCEDVIKSFEISGYISLGLRCFTTIAEQLFQNFMNNNTYFSKELCKFIILHWRHNSCQYEMFFQFQILKCFI